MRSTGDPAGIDGQSIRDVEQHGVERFLEEPGNALRFPTEAERDDGAAKRFNQLDGYVWQRLRSLRVKRKERNLRPGEADRWSREYFWNLGLHRLRGTVRYPEQSFWQKEAA